MIRIKYEGLDKMYGGLPDWGGFQSRTEYEIGVGRMAEACHCILGSLHKAKRRLDGQDGDIKSKYLKNKAVEIEIGHIIEENGIVQDTIDEYSRDIYVKLHNRGLERYPDMPKDMMRSGQKLAELANNNFNDLKSNKSDYEETFFELAKASYKVVSFLGQAVTTQMKNYGNSPIRNNVFYDRKLFRACNDLDKIVDKFVKKYRS